MMAIAKYKRKLERERKHTNAVADILKSESEDEGEMDNDSLLRRDYEKYIKENFDYLGNKITNKKDKSI